MQYRLAAALLAATAVSAQQDFTSTVCNPLEKTCPDDKALGKTVTIDFQAGDFEPFHPLDGTVIKSDSNGANFIINSYTDAPTIETDVRIFFGKVDVWAKTAPGQGIVTSIVLQSGDLDEIDWEWRGGFPNEVLTNYFGKACTGNYDRGTTVNLDVNTQGDLVKYTLDWHKDKLEWLVNDKVVRTLLAKDAIGCNAFPQTPMQIKMGTWVAGSPTMPDGTVEWVGGMADLSKAPFTATYTKVVIQDYMGDDGATSASAYHWSDMSGDASSIQVIGDDGNSTTTKPSSTSTTLTSATKPSSTGSANGTSTGSDAGATTGTAGSGSTPVESIVPAGAARVAGLSAIAAGAGAFFAFLL